MVWERGVRGIACRLRIGDSEETKGEYEAAEGLWQFLVNRYCPEEESIPEPLCGQMEEAVVWRIMAMRLERVLGEDGLVPKRKDGERGTGGPIHPALEAMAKARERYRKVMKELLAAAGDRESGPVIGLADLWAPVLEKGKGVLEDAMERERVAKRRKKRSSKKGANPAGN